MRAEAFSRTVDDLRDYWMREIPFGARRPRWWLVLLLCSISFFCGAAIASAAEVPCVRVKVQPTVMLRMGRYDIHAEMRVLRHDDHRRLFIEWTRDGMHDGSSGPRELAGAAAPFLHTLGPLRDKPGAQYEFIATVYNGMGKVVGRDRARILTPSQEFEP